MINKCKELMIKYREILVYLIVGVLTTIVSWVVCFLLKLPLDPTVTWQNFAINTGGWLAGVLFSYPLNRKLVFKSTNPHVVKEFLQFAGSTVSTWLLDIVIMEVTVNVLHMDYWIAKIFISAVLVTIINYVLRKVLIFNKKK